MLKCIVLVFVTVGLQGCGIYFDKSSLASQDSLYQNYIACTAMYIKVSKMKNMQPKWHSMSVTLRQAVINDYHAISTNLIDRDINNSVEWMNNMQSTDVRYSRERLYGDTYRETTTSKINNSDWYKYLNENLKYCERRFYNITNK